MLHRAIFFFCLFFFKLCICEKPDFGPGSRLRVGKVLAHHNVRSKTIPLIKCAKVMWFFKIFIFHKNNIKGCTKETKIFFFYFFRSDKD